MCVERDEEGYDKKGWLGRAVRLPLLHREIAAMRAQEEEKEESLHSQEQIIQPSLLPATESNHTKCV